MALLIRRKIIESLRLWLNKNFNWDARNIGRSSERYCLCLFDTNKFAKWGSNPCGWSGKSFLKEITYDKRRRFKKF